MQKVKQKGLRGLGDALYVPTLHHFLGPFDVTTAKKPWAWSWMPGT
jgi:hypothetical protein